MTEPVVREIPQVPDTPFPLGRRGINHDPRSRNFAFTAPEPRPIVDVAWRRRVPVYDQGADLKYKGTTYRGLGCCVPSAGCGALSTYPHKHRFQSMKTVLSAYDEVTAIDPFDGDFPPDDPGSDGLSFAKVALRRGWVSRYEHVFSWDAFLQAMMVGPVIVGTYWLGDMFHPDADGRVHRSGYVAGGHEYECYGVDVANRRVWFFNSWSESWSVKGRFYMTWPDFGDLLADQGDATVLVP